MSDDFYAEIYFPLQALKNPKIQELVKDLNRYQEKHGIIGFWDDLAAWGRFDELEDALIKLGMPFDRYSSGYIENDPCRRHFRPAREGRPAVDLEYISANSMYGPLLTVSEVRQALQEKGAEQYLEELSQRFPEIEPLEEWLEG